jgi:hypothetical protein
MSDKTNRNGNVISYRLSTKVSTKLVKLVTFCRQSAPLVGNLKTVSTKPAAVQIGHTAHISLLVSLLIYQTRRWLHNSYSLGVLDNGMEGNNTNASSIDKNEHVVSFGDAIFAFAASQVPLTLQSCNCSKASDNDAE